MDIKTVLSYLASILSGIAACIPLAVALLKTTKAAVKEKNWASLLSLVTRLMEEAETKFSDGTTRKEWVLALVQTSSEYINYPIDKDALSTMIDSLVDLTKAVNAPVTEEEGESE